ncbi:scavenger receptor cysteine-rich domain-containing protein, partial [Salmonella sp. s51228]|uniref:scavenger receptor cysteine-rich domain-containing protein n=1 Tax=Salmonella sp. s51228 TaxID=3159652 RepID=UPI003980BBA7
MQVYHNNVWGGICDDLWGLNDATVVCRQMGYQGVIGYTTYNQRSDNYFWLDNVQCTGNEQYISLCPHNGWGS